jgi:hypothetical protein
MIRSKASLTILIMAGLFLASAGLFGQALPTTVRVPEGNRPILTDGIFSPGEWDDARKIQIRPDLQLLLKKSAGFVFLGLKYSPFTLSVVDLFISPAGEAIRQLHVSAQLGERLLGGAAGEGDNPPFVWGDTADWYANEIRWDAGKVQALTKEGKDPGEAQQAALFRYDGFEFQIRQSKFDTDEWLVRLESPMPPDWSKPVVFPEGTSLASTQGWLKLTGLAAAPAIGQGTAAPASAPAGEVVAGLYGLVSSTAGWLPDWDKVRSLFLKEAVIVLRTSRTALTSFSLDGFIKDFVDFYERPFKRGEATVIPKESGFTEKVVQMKTWEYGDMAHVLVLYEAQITGSDIAPQRGVDSWLLVKQGGRWLIAAAANEIVTAALQVPPELRDDH